MKFSNLHFPRFDHLLAAYSLRITSYEFYYSNNHIISRWAHISNQLLNYLYLPPRKTYSIRVISSRSKKWRIIIFHIYENFHTTTRHNITDSATVINKNLSDIDASSKKKKQYTSMHACHHYMMTASPIQIRHIYRKSFISAKFLVTPIREYSRNYQNYQITIASPLALSSSILQCKHTILYQNHSSFRWLAKRYN